MYPSLTLCGHAQRCEARRVPSYDFYGRNAVGTARVQAVDPEVSPRFHALLLAYGARTGVPVLLNTSFNLAGEPIVNSAAEGYSTFRRSGLDLLVAGRCVVARARAGGVELEEAVS